MVLTFNYKTQRRTYHDLVAILTESRASGKFDQSTTLLLHIQHKLIKYSMHAFPTAEVNESSDIIL